MYELVHFLHLVSGTVWAGGAVFFAFVVEPTLLRLGPEAIRRYGAEQARFAGPLMAGSGMLLLITGAARAFIGGGVRTPADLLQPYGLWVAAAFVVVLAVTIFGGAHRAAAARLLAADGDLVAALRVLQRRNAVVTGTGILATIGIMAILGMGLY